MIQILTGLFLTLFLWQANALSWQDLWLNQDQQAQQWMVKGQFVLAKDMFRRKDWAAAATYKAGDYERASRLFEELHTAQGYYNQGNALAHMGQYEQAIAAYDKALALNPHDKEAWFNRELIKELMKKEKEKQQSKDQQNKDQQNKDQQNKDQQNKDQQSKDQQSKDQQSKDQQNKDQQNKDQQNKDQQNKDQQNKDQQNKDQQNKDQQSKDQQSKDQQSKDQQSKDQQKKNSQGDFLTQDDREKQQAKEQWLKLIPDDPGGLIREKFLRDHLRRQHGWYQ